MKIRELLQIELWTKRTSRKMFVGFGTFLGVVVAGFVIWSVVDRNWITPGERSAARVALGKLDALQGAGLFNPREFVVRAKLAGRRVDDAHQAARTTRDKMIVGELMNFQSAVVANQAMAQKQLLGQQQNSRREPDQRMQGFGVSGLFFDSRKLHKALD
jgi:hypothetical protein